MSTGCATLLCEDPLIMRLRGDWKATIHCQSTQGHNTHRNPPGWSRLLALCKLLKRGGCEWSIEWTFTPTVATANVTWRKP